MVGAVDGMHIKIIAPSIDEDVYVNRKRYHSINTHIVSDCEDYIYIYAFIPDNVIYPYPTKKQNNKYN